MNFSALDEFLYFLQNIKTIVNIDLTNFPLIFNLGVFFTDMFPS